jgi:hypothetical protein
MYALISSGQVVEFPLSLNKWRFENPSISLPKLPTEEQLNEVGIYSVQPTPKPAYDHTLNYESVAIQNENGDWVESWVESPASEQEILQRTFEKEIDIRKERDKLLQETDWIVIKAKETGTNLSAGFKAYRQALRDITLQEGFPHNVIWPTKPE